MELIKNYPLYLLLFIGSSITWANKSPEWQINPAESELSFTATQNDAPFTGTFKKFSGEIFVDPNNYKASSIHIVVDMTSLSAPYADLISTLQSPDWFDTKMFPKAEFKATQFNKTSDKTYEAIGSLTIRDKTAPVTLIFTAEESPKNHAVVDGHTLIKRTVFGVGQGDWASTSEIKDDVAVHFKIVATPKD